LNLALCLGAGGTSYVSSATSGWSSTLALTGSNIQTFDGSASNFLGTVGNSIYLTGVQLERGTLATPFEVRPYALELQLCQRYYEEITYIGTLTTYTAAGYGNIAMYIPYKITKRAIPTYSFSYSQLAPSGMTFSIIPYTDTLRLYWSGSATVAGNVYIGITTIPELTAEL
jgi:hypothetical protein